MFNQGGNPEAVQQKDRVKVKKHLSSKIRIVQDHPESYLSQWVEKLRSRSSFENSVRTGETYLPCTAPGFQQFAVQDLLSQVWHLLFNNPQWILFLSLCFPVTFYTHKFLGPSTNWRKAFCNILHCMKNKPFLLVLHLPPANFIWFPLRILKDQLDLGWDEVVNVRLTILYGTLYPFISCVILIFDAQ